MQLSCKILEVDIPINGLTLARNHEAEFPAIFHKNQSELLMSSRYVKENGGLECVWARVKLSLIMRQSCAAFDKIAASLLLNSIDGKFLPSLPTKCSLLSKSTKVITLGYNGINSISNDCANSVWNILNHNLSFFTHFNIIIGSKWMFHRKGFPYIVMHSVNIPFSSECWNVCQKRINILNETGLSWICLCFGLDIIECYVLIPVDWERNHVLI